MADQNQNPSDFEFILQAIQSLIPSIPTASGQDLRGATGGAFVEEVLPEPTPEEDPRGAFESAGLATRAGAEPSYAT